MHRRVATLATPSHALSIKRVAQFIVWYLRAMALSASLTVLQHIALRRVKPRSKQ